MIILDEPYASVPLLDWMEASAHPVLANGFTEKLVAGGRTLNLVDADECARRLEAGERIYTNSENALAWILDHVDNPTLTDAIRLFKDKAAMREKLAPLSPGLFHKTVDRAGLEAVNVADLPLPVVLKPAVGFCSMGVYVIEEPEDWAAAVADIARREDGWHERYPESVVGGSEYLIEGYLAGTEYALDAYFDEDGAPHILNILRHDFAGPEETSDRMYLTDGTIVDAWNDRFTAWLAAVNEVVGARSIPVHVELRVDGDTIAPIEFNPLRFAGLGGTDVAFYGVGLRTYEAFLEDTPVDLAGAAWEVAQKRETQGLNHTLGVHFTKVEPGLVEAEMPITPALLQPFGFLHGGATIALLESVASAGGELACDLETEQPFGVEVTIRHKKSGREGDVARGVAKLAERKPSSKAGYKLYWDVAAYDGDGDVISDGVIVVKVVPKDYLAQKLAERGQA